ncbi:MAG: copper resistance protein NlpE, partial [bacterium]
EPRMRLPWAIVVATALIAAGCTRSAAPHPPQPATTPEAHADDLPLVGRFVGVLPCPDCSGIDTDLTLAGDWSGVNLFQLRQKFIDGSNANLTATSSGTWTTVRGMPGDRTAIVYQLTPSALGIDTARAFVVVDERHIRLLGADLQPLPSTTAATLTRVDGR